MRGTAAITVLLLGTLTPFAAFAADVDAGDPDSVISALQDLGYRATLDADSYGDPMVRTKMNRLNVVVFFYDCVENKDCKAIQYSIAADYPDGSDFELGNTWNRNHVNTTVSLDDEMDPVLRMTIRTDGSISYELFEAATVIWEKDLDEFKDLTGI